MDARMSQQAMEGLSDEPGFGEKHREPEGQVVGGISLGTFLLPQESTSPVGARTHRLNQLLQLKIKQTNKDASPSNTLNNPAEWRAHLLSTWKA